MPYFQGGTIISIINEATNRNIHDRDDKVQKNHTFSLTSISIGGLVHLSVCGSGMGI